MRGSNGYPPRGNYDSYSNQPSAHGQMVINMKTTVTTSGGQHNGLVVHSAIQSASPSTSQSSWMSPFSESSSRRFDDGLDLMRSNTSLHRSSPLPIQMVPSTSRETLISIGRERETSKRENGFHQIPQKPPSPPPSPIYSFKGRDSPPDEFIQPTKLVLNVFRPKHQESAWQTPISRSQVSHDTSSGGIQLSKKNALLNDAVTTTTTVEVFRAPMDEDHSMISLTPSPFGGAPLLVRTHGPQYEQWNDRKIQSMMADDDRRDMSKGVQWKERLIEESDRRYRDNGSDFYDEIVEPPQYIHHDYRPKSSSFQPVTHPIVMSGSRDDLRSQPPPYPAPLSPLYIVPDRHRNTNSVSPGQWSRRSNGYQDRDERRRDERKEEQRDDHRRENEQNHNRERYHHRRSKSSNRDDASVSHRSLRHRSMSPSSRRSFATSIGGSQEEFLMERVIDELEMISSPLAESEDSLISEMSTKNDVAKSSWLEYRGIRRRIEDGNESDFEEDEESEVYGPPPIPERDYSRFRPLVYRKRGEEFPMRRSKSYERPCRPRTPERKWSKNARGLVDKTKKINPIYATPIRKKITSNAVIEPPIIEEFVEEVPRYVRSLRTEKTELKDIKETVIEDKLIEKDEEKEELNSSLVPVIDLSTEVEFSSKVERPIGKLAREDSLTLLLKRQLSSKNQLRIREELPEYVEPKDPIIKELQEFLKIEPKSSDENSINSNSTSIEKEKKEEPVEKEKSVEADEHRLIVRGWQELLKSSSSSSTSSTSSTTV